ncbi:MAG TPA: Gfo/Idh/MocA family oxidoreductase, partial [Planctomycetaceae bacterium]|nr:Gfo/Idh/MocA family oxidoreductase [Planctomycetaceae bacterium]
MQTRITRRTFTKAGATALGLAALGTPHARAASQRIRVGFIGVANRGGQLLTAFLKHDDVEVVALCDVQGSTLDHANQKWCDGKADTYKDFRKLIDRKDIDAVVIATPDHWHALQTIYACDAGKDVYVEKPLSITIYEGRKMVEAARRNKRVVQVGTHRRSSDIYKRLVELVQADTVGKVTVSRAYRLSNMYPSGIGHAKPATPPPDLDWDLWLGPRPERPYQENIAPYKFRWWMLYSSQMANWGVHYLDAIRWVTGELAPSSVCAMGGRYAVDDDRTIPDTMEAVFEFASGRLAVFGQYEASGNPAFPRGEIEFRGTLGTVYVDTRGFEIVPERGGQFQDRAPRMKPMKVEGGGRNPDLTALHARNFLDCVKSREKPSADVEI